MTELTKAISRRTTLFLDNRKEARSRDRITVTLYPDQTIGFREHGRRREYRIPLVVCYKAAIIEAGKEEKRERAIRRKVRRLGIG